MNKRYWIADIEYQNILFITKEYITMTMTTIFLVRISWIVIWMKNLREILLLTSWIVILFFVIIEIVSNKRIRMIFHQFSMLEIILQLQ